MKVLRVIGIKSIPTRAPGDGTRVNSSFYDEVANKVGKLARGKCLPIECESRYECDRLQSAIRTRGYGSVRRGKTVYAF